MGARGENASAGTTDARAASVSMLSINPIATNAVLDTVEAHSVACQQHSTTHRQAELVAQQLKPRSPA